VILRLLPFFSLVVFVIWVCVLFFSLLLCLCSSLLCCDCGCGCGAMRIVLLLVCDALLDFVLFSV